MAQQISIGTVVSMVASQVYSLPARLCNLTVVTSGGAVSVSLDASTWQGITLDDNKNFVTSAPFIRVTGATAMIIGKPY